ncbi:MAG: MAPEG family protein [Bacteriovoracaceae bacterium]|jgi:hypothetical protein|nr:hypothetical protein [Halobacteriovoraceae bacterium]MDP7319414.1 MAPEG family protein [Bacteriovoracaceae bacterium]
MEKYLILAMFLMGVLPVIVSYIMFQRRISALKRGEIKFDYFRTFQQNQNQLDQKMVAANRNYTNLFEMPILFFVVSLLFLVQKQVNEFVVFCAYFYVALRWGHTFIHLGSNKVKKRFLFFVASLLILLVMWIYLLGKIFLIS